MRESVEQARALAKAGSRVRLPHPLPNYPREAVMDAIAEFILLTVYCLTVSTILVLLARPVRWAIRLGLTA